MLAPKGTIAGDPERDDDVGPEEGDVASGVQDGRTQGVVMAQSSIGLSVVVETVATALNARCRWGLYLREFEEQPDGSRAAVWHRDPQDLTVAVPLTEGEFGPIPVNGEGVVLRGRATRADKGPWLVTVFLTNDCLTVFFPVIFHMFFGFHMCGYFFLCLPCCTSYRSHYNKT